FDRCRKQEFVVDQERGTRRIVSVDHLIVITDTEHVEGRKGEQPDEKNVGGGEVLELVDEQVTAANLHAATDLTIAQEDFDRPVDLFIEIDDAPAGEPLTIRIEEFAQTVDVVPGPFDVCRIEQAEANGTERFKIRTDRIGVGASTASTRKK